MKSFYVAWTLFISFVITSSIGMFGIARLNANTYNQTRIVLTCTPTRDFLGGFDDSGKITPIENWESHCIMTNATGKILGEWSFQPINQVPETREQAIVVGKDVIKNLQQYLYDQRFSDNNL